MLSSLNLTPPTNYGVVTYPPGASFGPRVMRDFEFVWMIEGDAEYHWGDSEVQAGEGTIVLCRPGATDMFYWDRNRRTRHAYFHFSLLKIPPDWPPLDAWPIVRLPEADDIIIPLFKYLLASVQCGSPFQLQLTIANILSAFLSGQSSAAEFPQEPLPDPVRRALTFIHQQLESEPQKSVQLREIAAAAFVSPEHICRQFKASTGKSPAEAVRLLRLDRAALLLARSNYSVGEIADLCGFANPFHFARRFKEIFKKTPSEYRLAIQTGKIPPHTSLLITRSI